MNLPNYFLVDLPPEATFSHQMIEDACRTLKRNREQYLANRNTASLIRLIASICDNWLEPEFLVHITGGCLPNPVFMSIILGLLVRSAQFVKCARGTSFLPRLFAHSLYETDGKLGACLEIAEWKGGNVQLETALFHEADC